MAVSQEKFRARASSVAKNFTMRTTLILMTICLCAVGATAQDRTPQFADYPARVAPTKSPAKVKIYSTPDTSCFRTMLRQTAKTGARFAGHYAIDYWGCGTSCARIGIVDLKTGRAYVSPFYVGIAGGGQHKSIKTEARSRLVLVNDPELVRQEYGDPPPEELVPAYFVWTGKRLLPITNGKLQTAEPKRAFDPCAGQNRD
jgi:hypothetical protein